MAQAAWPLVQRKFGETTRRDTWWLQPLLVFLGLSTFIVYATWAAFQGNHFEYGPYLSPFYSPLLFGDSQHAWFGPNPTWWPPRFRSRQRCSFSGRLVGFESPATTIGARTTKSFWADPPSCTVGEPRKSYLGERSFPARSAEHPPIFSVSRHRLHRHSDARRHQRLSVRGSRDGHRAFRHRHRQPPPDHQHDSAGWLHVQLSLAAASDWRWSG